MTTYYVDWEGAAGSGDGTSFANRANRMFDLGTSTVNAGDEIRIKKSPDPTSLGTGKVKKTHCAPYYNQRSLSNSNLNYSTSTGETYWSTSSSTMQGYETGDVIHFFKSTLAAGKNINGLYSVTVENGFENTGKVKLDNFTASDTDAESGTSYFQPVSASTIILNTDNITKSIACRDANRTAWTASSNVTCTANVFTSGEWNNPVDWQIGTGSDKIEITSSAASGKAAYWELPATLDLSGYQQISMLVRNFSVTSASVHHSLRLCTDLTGDTSVHTIPLNTYNAPTNYWMPIVVDLGTNLNSAIKSVAIYTDTTGTARSYYIHNIIACKASSSADSLTHNSLVGLNTTADPVWYSIGAIWDNIILLRTWSGKQGPYGYYGAITGYFSAANNSATIYKREPIFTPNPQANYWLMMDGLQESGTSSDWITVSGGWDETAMSTKNGKTFCRSNGNSRGIDIASFSYQDISNLYFNGFYTGFNMGSSDNALSQCGCSDMSNYCVDWSSSSANIYKLGFDYAFGAHNNTIELSNSIQHSSANVSDFYFKWMSGNFSKNAFRAYDLPNWHFDYINCQGHNQRGIYMHNSDNFKINTLLSGYSFNSTAVQTGSITCEVGNLTITDTSMGFSAGGTTTITNYNQYATKNIPGNTTSGRRFGVALGSNGCMQNNSGSSTTILGGTIQRKFYIYGGTIKTKNLVIEDTTDAYFTSTDGRLLMKDYDGTSGEYKNIFPTGEINPETTIRHTASGFAWKFIHSSATSTVNYQIGSVIVNSGSLVTIGVWVYVTNVSNKTAKLKLKMNTEVGMTADVVADSSSGVSNNTWTKLEATFTPNAAGVVNIDLESVSTSSTTDYTYFDDMEVAQA